MLPPNTKHETYRYTLSKYRYMYLIYLTCMLTKSVIKLTLLCFYEMLTLIKLIKLILFPLATCTPSGLLQVELLSQ